jgi:hypothetical protein
MRLNPKQAAIIAWSIVTIFIGGVGGYHIVPQLIYLHDLGESARTASGEIIETYPQMHNTCKYRFAVDNKTYEIIGHSCGNTSTGQKVTAYFSADDPTKSVNSDPKKLFFNDLISFLAAFLLFPIFAAIANYKIVKNLQSKSRPGTANKN